MSKQPGIYYDIGRKAQDLLYRDYTQQPPIHYRYGYFDWSFRLLCRIGDIVPGLGTAFRFIIPYQRLNQVGLQYLHDFVGITTGISLTLPPLLKFSGVIGSSFFTIGTDLSFDSATRQFTKCNAGFSFNTSILVASLTLNDMGDTINASCYHSMNPPTNTAIAAEVRHILSRRETAATLGAQHLLFPFTFVKARLGSDGVIGALIQQELWQTFFVTVTGEVNAKAVTRSAKLGLSLALRH